MSRKIIASTMLAALTLIGLTACTTGPTTLAATQQAVNTKFKGFEQTVTKTDTIKVTRHAGRAALGVACANNEVQLLDTSAVYVTRTYDLTKYLAKLKPQLTKQGYTVKQTKDSGGNPSLAFTRNGYVYGATTLNRVKIDGIDTNKAVLFQVQTTCVKR